MPDDSWMEAVRKRTHDLANKLMAHQEDIAVLQEQIKTLLYRIKKLEQIPDSIKELQHQATILRWLLGLVTTIAAAVLARAI